MGVMPVPGAGDASAPLAAVSQGKSGCRSRTRTYDPLINSQLLYLLSYAATRDTIIPLSIGAMSHGT